MSTRKPKLPHAAVMTFILLAAQAIFALPAFAQEVHHFDVPAPSSTVAIQSFGRQSGVQILASADVVAGKHLNAVSGDLTTDAAFQQLLAGTGLTARYVGDRSVALVADTQSSRAAEQGSASVQQSGASSDAQAKEGKRESSGAFRVAQAAAGQTQGPVSVENQEQQAEKKASALEEVVVTGSRIARSRSDLEGPAPVTVISGEQFKAEGFTTVYEVMNNLTQSFTAETPPTWGSTTVNARQLNLRGIGANHTLLLVDGLRVSDYPQASQGGNPYNFQNYNNLPAGMVDRVEILASGASAIYGSDAVAGVVNVILKHDYQGDNVTLRGGSSSRGGRNLWDLEWNGGKAGDNWNIVYAFQDFQRSPMWGRNRPYTESEADAGYGTWNPVDRLYGYQTLPGLWLDSGGTAIAPPAGACSSFDGEFFPLNNAPVVGLNGQTYNTGHGGVSGPYCGQRFFENWVLTPGIISTNGYVYGELRLDHDVKAYAAAGLWRTTGISNTELPFSVPYCAPQAAWNGTCVPNGFYDTTTGKVIDNYFRQFTTAEMGTSGNTYDREQNWDVHVGLKGTLLNGKLNWDATVGRALYWVDESYAGLNFQGYFDYFFGPQLGVTGAAAGPGVPAQCVTGATAAGTPCYTLNSQRFWNPISPQDYASFGVYGENAATSWVNQGQLILSGDLFDLWGGPLGFAAIVEGEKQGFQLYPDPRGLTINFTDPYQQYNTGGGRRSRSAIGTEFRLPLVPTLTATLAGRVDKYDDIRINAEPKTWAGGLEWRPVHQLLFRGSYGTNFHAPDMIDVYQQINTNTVGIYNDPYNCIINKQFNCPPTQHNTYFTQFNGGNPNLQPETGASWTYGLVWQSDFGLAASVDYVHVRLNNLIQLVGLNTVLADEAGCRTGLNLDGSPYTAHVPGSAYCQDVIADVVRDANGNIIAVHTGPINEAYASVSSVDAQLDYRWRWAQVGDFDFHVNYTLNLHYLTRTLASDPLLEGNYNNPYSRMNATLTWSRGPWEGTLWGERIGGVRDNGYNSCNVLPDGSTVSPGDPRCVVFKGYTTPWITFNLSGAYHITDRARVAAYLTDVTNHIAPIPFYSGGFEFIHNNAGQSYVGREWSLEFDYKFD